MARPVPAVQPNARSSASASAETPGAARAWATVALLGLLYIVSFVDRLILALMTEPIKAELAVSDVQIGLLIGSSFALFYTVASLPLARLADRSDRRLLIAGGALVWGSTTVASAFAGSFPQLLACRIGVGLGEAALVPAALSLIADSFPREQRSLPTSIFVTIGACGAAGAMILGAMVMQWTASADVSGLPLLADLAPWRLTLILVGAPAILLAFALLAAVREPTRRALPSLGDTAGPTVRRHMRQHPITYAGFFGAAAITSLVNYSLFAWFPAHLARVHGLAPATGGLLFGAIGIAATLAGGLAVPALATLLRRRGNADASVQVAMTCSGLAAPLLACSLLTGSLPWSLASLAPAILLQLGLAVLFVACSPLLSPQHCRAQMAALFFLCVNLVGFGAGPPLAALIAAALGPGPERMGQALALMVGALAPVQIALLFWSRTAFRRTLEEAAQDDLQSAGYPASMPPSIRNSAPEQ